MTETDPATGLPVGQEGSGDAFAALDQDKAEAMLAKIPDEDIGDTVKMLAQATENYKRHANQRRFALDALNSFGRIVNLAAAVAT